MTVLFFEDMFMFIWEDAFMYFSSATGRKVHKHILIR